MSDVVTVNITEVEEEVTVNVCEGISSVAFDEITGSARDNTDLNSELDLKEDSLSNPSTDGYILSSTIAGVRSWIAKSAGAVWGSITGNITDQTDLKNALDAKLDLTGTASALDMNNQDVIGVKDLECSKRKSTDIILSENSKLVGSQIDDFILSASHKYVGGGNNVSINEFYLRDAIGTDWNGLRIHNAISVSGVFETPATNRANNNTRCWWERDPKTNEQYWGGGSVEQMKLSNVGLEVKVDLGIYGTTDHKNQDVINIKDLDCATIDVGNGATGSFTSNDGKTVTVTKGIITSIV